MIYYLLFLLVMSVIAFILYGADKKKAQKGKWRIKESTLLLTGFFGGAVGALLAMQLFRHKTKHWYFTAINVAGLLVQAAVLYFVFLKAA